MKNKKKLGGIGFYLMILFAVALLVMAFMPGASESSDVKYSDIIDAANKGEIVGVLLDSEKAIIIAELSVEQDGGIKYWTAAIPADLTTGSQRVQQLHEDGKIQYFAVKRLNTIPEWVSYVVPAVFAVGLFLLMMFFMRQSAGSGTKSAMDFGRSTARMAKDLKKKVTFDSVAGANEEKEELAEAVEFLKNPAKYTEMGARIPKGFLLVGPPGTGKTLLAKAVAGEADVPFFSISGSDFMEMFVGVGASRVRDLFNQAKKAAPSIIFIDEIDAIGRHRGAGLGGGHDEREQTLNQMLVEMDGFEQNEGVIVMAATNRPDILDPALLRPGRFDRRVVVGYPDVKGREEILAVHARNKRLGSDVDLEEIAKNTQGFTGADLENLLNESALLAVRNNRKFITMEDVKEAIYKVMMGPEKKSRVVSDKAKRLTAYHEAGHALIVKMVSSYQKVDRVTIIPAGMAGGYTSFRPEEEKDYYTYSDFMESIKVALGGRAAEQLVLGEVSTGAGNDLKQVNSMVRNLIFKYGMSENFENMIFGSEGDEVFIGKDFGTVRNYSEETARILDNEIKDIIHRVYGEVLELLEQNIDKLHALAGVLIENEKVDAEEFEAIFSQGMEYYNRVKEAKQAARDAAAKQPEAEDNAENTDTVAEDEAAKNEKEDTEVTGEEN